MFGIGMPEMILILVIALIIIGPKKLPDLAKALGRAIGEFKKATSDFTESLEIDDELKDVQKTFGAINKDIKDAIDSKVAPENAVQNISAYPDDKKNKNPMSTEEPEGSKGSLKDA